MEEQKQQKESIISRWTNFFKSKQEQGSRPLTQFSYGEGMDKITIRLPKTVYEQMELVNLNDLMKQYPYDLSTKKLFLEKILPLTIYLEKPVSDINMLSLDKIETLIIVYCDALLSPLSQRVQEKTVQTIEEILKKLQ